MTPTASVVGPSTEYITVKDALGREMAIRRLNALDKLRLLRVAGPALSENQAWLGIAMLAASVVEFQGVPVPMPVTEQQIEAIVSRIGDTGLDAIADALVAPGLDTHANSLAIAGNLPGTPI